jgi:hypothetical protein
LILSRVSDLFLLFSVVPILLPVSDLFLLFSVVPILLPLEVDRTQIMSIVFVLSSRPEAINSLTSLPLNPKQHGMVRLHRSIMLQHPTMICNSLR